MRQQIHFILVYFILRLPCKNLVLSCIMGINVLRMQRSRYIKYSYNLTDCFVCLNREADRLILTTCQQNGACQSTFTLIAAQLAYKTATEVSLFIFKVLLIYF